MSFGLFFVGKKEAVIRDIQEAKGYGDTSQLDAVKKFAISEIEAFPATGYCNAISVEASGHHDQNSRSLTLKIQPIHLSE
jgi:hypothetical protein